MDLGENEIDKFRSDGEDFLRNGDYRRAVECFDRVLEALPGDLSALADRASALVELSEVESALAGYDRALSTDPLNSELLSAKASFLEAQDRWDESKVLYEELLRREPENVQVRLTFASALLKHDAEHTALACYEDGLRIDPSSWPLWRAKGDALLTMKQYDDAYRWFEMRVGTGEESFNAREWTRRGDRLTWSGNDAEALRYYDKALELDPTYTLAWLGKARALRSEKRDLEALAVLDAGLERDARNKDLLFEKGSLLFSLKKLDGALLCYEKLLETEPENKYALLNKGIVLMQYGDCAAAIPFYRKAIAVAPNFLQAMLDLCSCLEKTGQTQEALAWYGKALEIEPDSATALNNKGNLLMQSGQPAQLEEARQLFQAAVEKDPSESLYWVNLGIALKKLGRVDECRDWLHKGLQRDFGSDEARAGVLNALAALESEQGRNIRKAVEHIRAADAAYPTSPVIQANMAEILMKSGEYAEARRYADAADAEYADKETGCAVSFLRFACDLLEHNEEGAYRELGRFLERVQSCLDRKLELAPAWSFVGYEELLAESDIQTRFLLLTLIDLQTGRIDPKKLTFYACPAGQHPNQQAPAPATAC